jgi:DNA-binding MarR family transcriptional regulator
MQLEMSATRLSKVLWNLELKGYVARSIDELDHRKEQVHPTEVGRTLARQIISQYASIAKKVFGHWPEDVVSDFVRLYRTVTYDE